MNAPLAMTVGHLTNVKRPRNAHASVFSECHGIGGKNNSDISEPMSDKICLIGIEYTPPSPRQITKKQEWNC